MAGSPQMTVKGHDETKPQAELRLSARKPPQWKEFIKHREMLKKDLGLEPPDAWSQALSNPQFSMTPGERDLFERVIKTEGGTNDQLGAAYRARGQMTSGQRQVYKKAEMDRQFRKDLEAMFEGQSFESDPLKDIQWAMSFAHYKDLPMDPAPPSRAAANLWQIMKEAPRPFISKWLDVVKPVIQSRLKDALTEKAKSVEKAVEDEDEDVEAINQMLERYRDEASDP